jgi:putative acetyltransferase
VAELVAAAFGSPAEARLVELIRASPHFIPELSLVAEFGDRVAGHVMISFASLQAADGQRRIAVLSPLAVAPDFQRRGIGSALVREVTARADERGEPVVILEGSPAFHGRLGFEHSVLYGIHITLPSWAPPEAAQAIRFRNYDPSLRGRVVYPPAFDEAAGH